MTDVGTLQSQPFPTPLINKSPYDVMAFETNSYKLSAIECCGLVNFKKLNLKPCLSDIIQCIVLDFFCSN